MGTSLINKKTPVGPYSSPMSRDLWCHWSYWSFNEQSTSATPVGYPVPSPPGGGRLTKLGSPSGLGRRVGARAGGVCSAAHRRAPGQISGGAIARSYLAELIY